MRRTSDEKNAALFNNKIENDDFMTVSKIKFYKSQYYFVMLVHSGFYLANLDY